MNEGFLSLINPTLTIIGASSLLISCILFWALKTRLSHTFRLSLICTSALLLLSSLLPSLAQVFTVSFLPSNVYYQLTDPLKLAPFLILIAGFAGSWAILTLVNELYAIFNRNIRPPGIPMTFLSLVIFTMMLYQLHDNHSDYKIVNPSQKIANYAIEGTDPIHLKKIYLDVIKTNDTKANEDILTLLSSNPNTPSDLLRMIFVRTTHAEMDTISQINILLALTKNPNTPPDTLENVMTTFSQARVASTTTLAFLARNPNFSPDMLLQLAQYPNCEIRRAIISYPNIPVPILNQLMESDPDVGVRRDAKRRLEFLHGISHLEATKDVPPTNTQATTTPSNNEDVSHIFEPEKLAQAFDRAEFADNAETLIESIASNCYLSNATARKIYARTMQLKPTARMNILVQLAANPQTPHDILLQLAAEKDLVILRALSTNPNLPEPLVNLLFGYPDCKIRKKIICSSTASQEIISKLQNDPDQSVSLESHARIRESDTYLQGCRDIKKMNASCQRFYDTSNTIVQTYPNTTLATPVVPQTKNLSLALSKEMTPSRE